MTNLEAISIVRELPRALRRQSKMQPAPFLLFRGGAEKIAKVLDQSAMEKGLTLNHRKFTCGELKLESKAAVDLLLCFVDTIDPPYCYTEIGEILLQERARYVQLISAAPLPFHSDWWAYVDYLGFNAQKLSLHPGTEQPSAAEENPNILQRVHIQHLHKYSEVDAELALSTAMKLRQSSA